MTKRIFGGAFIVSLVAIISAVAMVLGVAYTKEQQLFKRQLEQQAMLLAATMENTSPDDDVESLRKLSHDIHGTFENRITYIGQDGTVLFDNEADPATMENHLGREEVVAAKQSGTGTAIRESYTMSEMTVYCARVIGYDCIVRVAGTMANTISFLANPSTSFSWFSLRGMMGFPVTLNTITFPVCSACGAFPFIMSMITSSFRELYSAQYFSSLVIFSSKAHISSSSPSTLMTLPRATMRSFGYKALINCMLALFTP